MAGTDPESVLKTVPYCIDHGIYSVTDFESVLDNYVWLAEILRVYSHE
ncbi:MAG: hypothetical protein K9J30_06400 [Bacteroidales bacterium]|nr:hypothetical protein [Bacteroidales bacterium]